MEEALKTEEIEAEILRAMRARMKHFKEQADSLTLEGVRRALEKDLGLDIFSLDAHKRFIKQCMEECFSRDDEVGISTKITSTQDPQSLQVNKEVSGEKEEPKQLKDFKHSGDVNENAEESHPDNVTPNHKLVKSEALACNVELSEDVIKEAITKRGPYFKANLEQISLVKVRRQLEEDLNLEKNTLDAYKSFISDFLDKILQAPETAKAANDVKKKTKKSFQTKEVAKVKGRPIVATEDSGSSNLDDDRSGDDDVDKVKRPKKRSLQKPKSNTRTEKKRKTSSGEKKSPVYEKTKAEELCLQKSDESEDEKNSQDGQSPSVSSERPKKKQEKSSVQAYKKNVEHLKSIIKACGIGIPPAVYKRVKQAPEGEREAFLIKELEEILEREGLSTNPSEKEIKSVKKRKERARELEGIDMSNVVSTSRRRSTSNYIPVPKQKIEIESDEDDGEDEGEEGDEDEEDAESTDEAGEGSGKSYEGSEGGADEDSD